MNKNKELPSITFVVPTLNEEKRIKKCLDSIFLQDYPKDKIKIILIDAGSVDRTREIAAQYNCKIYFNEKKFAEPGMVLGYKKAKSDYVVFMAADNVISEKNWLKKIVKPFLYDKKNIYLSFSRVINDPKDNVWSRYLNINTDPFNAFIYGNASHPLLFKHQYSIDIERDNFIIYKFNTKEFPLIAFAQCAVLKSGIPRDKDSEDDDILPVIKIINNSKKIAFVKNTGIYHYSLNGFKDFVSKFKKRIYVSMKFCNYKKKERFMGFKRKIRKYFWILYSLSIIFPLITAIKFYIKTKDRAVFLHPIACFVQTVLIFYNLLIINIFKK